MSHKHLGTCIVLSIVVNFLGRDFGIELAVSCLFPKVYLCVWGCLHIFIYYNVIGSLWCVLIMVGACTRSHGRRVVGTCCAPI